MSGLACANRLAGVFQTVSGRRICIKLLSSLSASQDTLVNWGRDQCLVKNIRPSKLPFKDIVQQWREQESNQNPRYAFEKKEMKIQ